VRTFSAMATGYHTKPVDALGSEDFRLFFYKGTTPISPFHDVPLWVDKEKHIANMVVEIPKGSRPKLEISKFDRLNPIKQDVKKGKLRFVHDPYPFNYGAFPQTWENPSFFDDRTQAKGDNDPVDVCEIGSKVHNTGDIIQVKVLGCYAMIDEGETDWKILAIDINDENASKYSVHSDIPKEKLDEVFTFLRDYKIPDGNPPNKFGFNDEFKDLDLSLKVIEETHEEWRKLVTGKIDNTGNIEIATTQLTECTTVISSEEAENVLVQQFKKLTAKN